MNTAPWVNEEGKPVLPPKANSEVPKMTVESIDNHIYFYSSVGQITIYPIGIQLNFSWILEIIDMNFRT